MDEPYEERFPRYTKSFLWRAITIAVVVSMVGMMVAPLLIRISWQQALEPASEYIVTAGQLIVETLVRWFSV